MSTKGDFFCRGLLHAIGRDTRGARRQIGRGDFVYVYRVAASDVARAASFLRCNGYRVVEGPGEVHVYVGDGRDYARRAA